MGSAGRPGAGVRCSPARCLRHPLQEAGESEAAAMARILELPSEYVLQTAANMDEARGALYEQNDAVIAGMLRWQAADAGEGPAAGTLDQEVD